MMINDMFEKSQLQIFIADLKSSSLNRNWMGFRTSLLLPILLTLFLLIIISACDTTATDCESDTFVVTTVEDIYDGVCNEHCSLRDAVAASNTCTLHDIYPIELPAGTYTLSLRGPDDNRGDLNFLASASIIGVSPATTIIEGNSSWNYRILTVEEEAYLHLENVSIKSGDLEIGVGGGILNLGILSMMDVVFERNASMIGGGLYNAGNANLVRVDFNRNQALSPDGLSSAEEQIYRDTEFNSDCGGGFANVGTMLVSDSTIERNRTGDGGGLCNGGGGTITIRDSRILNNLADFHSRKGGGIYNFGDLTLENSEVTNNMALVGGGIYQGGPRGDSFDYSDSGNLILDHVLVQNNTAERGFGGGLFLRGGEFDIHHSLILDNHAKDGGGIHLESSGVITHTTIARNDAVGGGPSSGLGRGGGIFSVGADVEVTNVTLSSNQAELSGGAAYIETGTAHFSHVTFAHNVGGWESAGGLNTGGGSVSIGNSLMAFNGAASCVWPLSVISEGNNLCEEDGSALILSELTEDNGQWVHVLLASSPAINRVPVDECPADDQRGMERPQGDLCDIGAYEFEAMVMSADSDAILFSTATPTPQAGSSPDQPTLNRDVLCWEGPGALYKTVSSVLKGVQVTLLGRGLEGDWWIIDNPRYAGVACWIPGEALDVDPTLDLTTLLLIKAPPLPTPIPTAITGCLYQGPNDNQAVCYPISQCPVPFNQTQGACIP